MTTPRPRILFLDAYDSFSNNITALLTTLLGVDVFVLPIDSPLLTPDGSCSSPTANEHENEESLKTRLRDELSRYAAVICGPGPGSPAHPADVGLMRHIWALADEDLVPVLGICLGFQSLVVSCGGGVRRLRGGGLHGMVRGIAHRGDDVFSGVGAFRATLYHSLGADVGQDGVVAEGGEGWRWRARGELVPLAWGEEAGERILMAVRHRTKPFWGLQYHPESVCTEEEGNRVVRNWFGEAVRWNEARGRVPVGGGPLLARDATKPSLLSRLSSSGMGGDRVRGGQWWESLETDAEVRSMAVPLPHAIQVPDIVEAVEPEGSERIVLDSANAASAASARADVRGRYSIVATGLEKALRIEHHTGDDYAVVRLPSAQGLPAGLSQRVPLAPYGDIWGFVASFHEARHIEASESAAPPFVGGFMGYITYEQGLGDIGISLGTSRHHHRPDVCLVWVAKSLVIDHLTGIVRIQQLQSRRLETDTWLENTTAKLMSLLHTFQPKKETPSRPDASTPGRPPGPSTKRCGRASRPPSPQAENLMIVDLVRHDLHGVCGAGRVRVPDLLRVEEYQSVFQMVTVVEGRLPEAAGRSEGTSLPPGSMTGAPKRRSCEILGGIEDGKERGLYSGVVGYMCATGRGDWSVTIRSLFRWDDEQMKPEEGSDGEEAREVWRIGAGGAVTILSTAEGEREEMFTKLAGPLRIFADSW
ncbi:hypothetical protein B0H67DRAFT_576464 [Lasiosphaeris hirsuta]|uniref:aminodeoxychorismate synthase n=1 Tax=Lasiosphaeris hirsuta TaxID=260670 RepID=A0AA40E0J8_9PEZI|nr:hypothetical protein B0H67DRAFT_576464 [Lasiosphaeris hirsuta]